MVDTNNEEIKKLIESYNLSAEERETLQLILAEELESDSHVLGYLYDIDYEETPVTIDEFIESEDFLGPQFDYGRNIYPFWREKLREIFDPSSEVTEIILSGSIGQGKSTVAAVAMAYILHHVLCLRQPQLYYNLAKNSYLALAFINLTLAAAYGIGYRKFMDILKESPWFVRNGSIKGRKGSELYVPNKGIDLLAGSKPSHTIGRDVFAAFLDELSFAGVQDSLKAKKQVMELYTNIRRRMESRFMVAGKIPCKIFLVSSKNRESDFLESYMNAVRGRPDVLIVDEPIWVVKSHVLNLCGKTFRVCVGGRLLPSKVPAEDEPTDVLLAQGYRILDVPVEYKRSFESNIEKALNDIAGIATASGFKYMVPENIKKVMGTGRNMFTVDIINIGLRTPFEISEFVDLNRVTQYLGSKVYIHMDLSKNGDNTGIAIVLPESYQSVVRVDDSTGQEFSYRDLKFRVLGCVALKALPGSEIPYYRIKEFVDWLTLHFKVMAANADGYQSLEMTQYFTLKGLRSRVVSVDRTPCVGYATTRSAIDDERIVVPDHPLLEKEWMELEETETGKIDHMYDESGNPAGSKDVSDCIAGCIQEIVASSESMEIVNNSKETALRDLQATLGGSDYDDDDDLLAF
jgi:hypothetical protein